ncbi:hypothetical protein V502_08540 [Pseudogymnoascus sp. VKM F-4520 (FW-2644)]|nr:hypothetical protein V502_08540 [Pseudogymnoascus sp. VKM F-4520 (FW-2644)]
MSFSRYILLHTFDLVGKWLARTGKRDDIFLATKFAFLHIGDQPGPIYNTSPKYVKIACEKSLKRLGVRCIDLYYCHRVDGVTPIEETVKAMVELKNEGMIKYIGLSEISSETLRCACKVHHIDAVQIEYSLWSLDIEHPDINLFKTCRELGVATVAYSLLGHGILTGAYKSVDDLNASDVRRYMPRFSPENFPKNLELVNALSAFAETKGCTSSQLTLAWLLAQGDDIFPIPGTKKIEYLEENLGALKVDLTKEDVQQIRSLVERAGAQGGRYPDHAKDSLFADTPELKK